MLECFRCLTFKVPFISFVMKNWITKMSLKIYFIVAKFADTYKKICSYLHFCQYSMRDLNNSVKNLWRIVIIDFLYCRLIFVSLIYFANLFSSAYLICKFILRCGWFIMSTTNLFCRLILSCIFILQKYFELHTFKNSSCRIMFCLLVAVEMLTRRYWLD